MKLFAFQRKLQGERLYDAFVLIWRTAFTDGRISPLRSLGIAVMLPVPILRNYQDNVMDALMRGWRMPRIGVRYFLLPNGKRKFAIRAWMHEIGKQELLAYRWQIEEGIYPPKEGEK